MSKFFTPIKVDIDAVKKLLPKDVYIDEVRWNARSGQVEIYWDHQPFHSGTDYPIEFKAEQLKAKQLPKGVGRPPAPRPAKKPALPVAAKVAATQVAARTGTVKAPAATPEAVVIPATVE